MTRLAAFIVLIAVAAAWAGHELPIYPSFYPHEIEIKTVAPEQAAGLLAEGKIQAYVGSGLHVPAASSAQIGMIESLGAFMIVRVNAQSSAANQACAIVRTLAHALERDGMVFHAYPVTPFHGDYLYHADLADVANARLAKEDAPLRSLKVKSTGMLAQHHPEWVAQGDDWDAEIREVDAASLVSHAMLDLGSMIAPPWLKFGWFHAERLLRDALADTERIRRVEAAHSRLIAGDYSSLVERINLERDLVSALTADCRVVVAGYTIKREHVNVEFSAGIENIGYDAISGLNSPMFLRTVKLKDFPWNGWLALGTQIEPSAAWNPIGGMNDPFGRLLGFAVTDPALLPAPYEAGWMLNRIADLPVNVGR